ncbi:hypothetical protein ACFL4A_02435 [bacterium]
MKKILLFLILLLMMTSLSQARMSHGSKGKGSGKMCEGKEFSDGKGYKMKSGKKWRNPGERRQNYCKKMSERLKLSEKQAEDVRKFLDKGWKEIQIEKEKMRTKVMEIREKYDKEIEKILSSEQVKEFNEMKEERKKKRKERKQKRGQKQKRARKNRK